MRSLIPSTVSMMALLAVGAGASGAGDAAAPPPPAVAEVQLRMINHRFVNAFIREDGDFMDVLTAADFLLTSNGGEWIGRADHLKSMRTPSRLDGVSYRDVEVRLFGEVALIHGVFEALVPGAKVSRVRYTDVYAWDGAAWYDAHLAPDYVVMSGDGSYNDRATALTNFARPTFATQMKSFPVDKVNIRRFGEVALIHAENAYEMKDGRKGVSRYTDIWLKQDGSWRCILAHINVYKAPKMDD